MLFFCTCNCNFTHLNFIFIACLTLCILYFFILKSTACDSIYFTLQYCTKFHLYFKNFISTNHYICNYFLRIKCIKSIPKLAPNSVDYWFFMRIWDNFIAIVNLKCQNDLKVRLSLFTLPWRRRFYNAITKKAFKSLRIYYYKNIISIS